MTKMLCAMVQKRHGILRNPAESEFSLAGREVRLRHLKIISLAKS